MAFTYDIEKDALFKRGEAKGEKRGKKIGEIEKAREMVTYLLTTNKHSMEELAEISGLSLEEVKQIAREQK